MPFGHWTFLRILWERDGLTQRELSAEAGVMEPSTFAALQAMEKAGYIARRRLGDNRKNFYVYLTPKGRALEGKLVPLAKEVNAIAVRGLAESQVKAARDTLLAIISNLSRPSLPRSARAPSSAGSRRGSVRRTPGASSPPRRSRAA